MWNDGRGYSGQWTRNAMAPRGRGAASSMPCLSLAISCYITLCYIIVRVTYVVMLYHSILYDLCIAPVVSFALFRAPPDSTALDPRFAAHRNSLSDLDCLRGSQWNAICPNSGPTVIYMLAVSRSTRAAQCRWKSRAMKSGIEGETGPPGDRAERQEPCGGPTAASTRATSATGGSTARAR